MQSHNPRGRATPHPPRPYMAHTTAQPEDGEAAEDELLVSSLEPETSGSGAATRAVPLLAGRLSPRDKLIRGGSALALVVAVLIAVASGAIASAPHGGQALPTATPTTPMIAAHAPVPLAASPWETIPLPALGQGSRTFAPAPTNPATIFACAAQSRATKNGGQTDGPIALWRSRDTGRSWQRLAVPLTGGIYCGVQVDAGTGGSVDGHERVLVWSMMSKVADPANCLGGTALLSQDGGDSWQQVLARKRFPSAATDERCAVILTARHLYLWHFSLDAASQNAGLHTTLERGDDGTAWSRADAGIGAGVSLYPLFMPGAGDDLGIAGMLNQAASESLWRTSDAGGHWQRFGTAGPGTELVLSHEPASTRDRLAGKVIYGLTLYTLPERLFVMHVTQTTDGQHWQALPPMPIPGADPDHIGALEPLGVATGGKLLFLGANPTAGIPHAGSDAATWREATQWLWAWNPAAGRWEIPRAPLAVPWPDTCGGGCWQPRLSWGAGPNGNGYGTYVWLTRPGDAGLYRAFVPA